MTRHVNSDNSQRIKTMLGISVTLLVYDWYLYNSLLLCSHQVLMSFVHHQQARNTHKAKWNLFVKQFSISKFLMPQLYWNRVWICVHHLFRCLQCLWPLNTMYHLVSLKMNNLIHMNTAKCWKMLMVAGYLIYKPFMYWGYFSWTRLVRSPPSSRIRLRGCPSGKTSVCSIHQMYSSSVSPFQAYTGTPVLAVAAAAWSWVEKMLHDDHWTCKKDYKTLMFNTIIIEGLRE